MPLPFPELWSSKISLKYTLQFSTVKYQSQKDSVKVMEGKHSHKPVREKFQIFANVTPSKQNIQVNQTVCMVYVFSCFKYLDAQNWHWATDTVKWHHRQLIVVCLVSEPPWDSGELTSCHQLSCHSASLLHQPTSSAPKSQPRSRTRHRLRGHDLILILPLPRHWCFHAL